MQGESKKDKEGQEIFDIKSIPNVTFSSVQLPVFFEKGGTSEENKKKALRHFGGAKQVWETVRTAGQAVANPIAFRLRPDDVLSHPIHGEIKPCCGILLKVKVRAGKDGNKGEEVKSVEALGRVTQNISFNELADFQYLPPKRHKAEKVSNPHQIKLDFARLQREVTKAQRDSNRIAEEKGNDANESDDGLGTAQQRKQFSTLFLPPTVFSESTKQYSERFVFQRKSSSQTARSPESSLTWSLADSCDPPKELPSNHPLLQWKLQAEEDGRSDLDRAVAEKFTQRAAWRAVDLFQKLQSEKVFGECKLADLKKTMGCHAYRMNKGPWRGVYLRLGYDPRADKMSRIFQVLETRRKRHAHQANKRRRQVQLSRGHSDATAGAGGTPKWYDVCGVKYEPNRYNTWQLCDIRDEELRARIKAPCAESTEVHPKFGWFTEDDFGTFRSLMTSRVRKTMNGTLTAATVTEVPKYEDETWEDTELPVRFWYSSTAINRPKTVPKTGTSASKPSVDLPTEAEDPATNNLDDVEGFAVFEDDEEEEDSDEDEDDEDEQIELQNYAGATSVHL